MQTIQLSLMLILVVCSELKASMSASGVSAEAQQKLLGLHERNIKLSAEVKDLQDKLDVLSTSGDTHTYVGHLTISVRLQYADAFSLY